jgi:hypothetical protein
MMEASLCLAPCHGVPLSSPAGVSKLFDTRATYDFCLHIGGQRTKILRFYICMNKLLIVRFQVLTAASMKFRIVFWDVLPCKIIVDRRFRGTCSLQCTKPEFSWRYRMKQEKRKDSPSSDLDANQVCNFRARRRELPGT